MINFSFKSKANGVPILSKNEIEFVSEMILEDYDSSLLNTPKALDVEHFLECYADLDVDYQDLTHNQSILGMIVFNDGYVPVYDKEHNKAERLPVEVGTVLIDNSLLEDGQTRRGRFTVCHEISHWFLHKGMYTVDKNQISLFDDEPKTTAIKCRSVDIESAGKKQLITDDDWMEWQADYLASALLMPWQPFKDLAEMYIKKLGLQKQFQKGGAYVDYLLDGVARYVSEAFEVSITAAKIRLKNLGFTDENRQISILEG